MFSMKFSYKAALLSAALAVCQNMSGMILQLMNHESKDHPFPYKEHTISCYAALTFSQPGKRQHDVHLTTHSRC